MPVGTHAAVKAMTPDQVRATGAGIVLANTYHLMLRPGEGLIEKFGGLHEFMRWEGPILTDSGGFQVYSLPSAEASDRGVKFKNELTGEVVDLTPERSITVQNALERSRLSRELRQLSQRLDHGETLIGTSEGMQKLKDELKTAAGADTRILITGENGTGKELVARQIHRLSNRREGPFVEVNCAAIPEELIESELFGHVRGSFTGASSDRRGRFEESNGGTLFLDEVADMSLKTQAKVLRALEEQRFQRVGSADLIEVDVRVLAATNKELEEEIRAERFREDLYFRLAVIPLGVPALRQRPADVPLLAAHFIDQFARELGRRPKTFDDDAMATLQAYGWPGNVRELRNLMERLMIMVPGEVITDVDLPPSLKGASAGRTPSQPAQLGSYDSLKAARDAFEVDYIRRELDLNDGKVSRTADALQIERSHLYRKMKSLGIR